MSHSTSNKTNKGKEVVVVSNGSKRPCRATPGSLFIRKINNAILQSDSDDENVPPPIYSTICVDSTLMSYSPATQAECSNATKRPLQPSNLGNIISGQTQSTLDHHSLTNSVCSQERRYLNRDRERIRRQRMTDQQREENNARRRASRQNLSTEDREAINATRRIARQNRPIEVLQEVNASRRASRLNLPSDVREEINARQRTSRHNRPIDIREEVSASRRVTRQNQPVEVREEINASRRAARQDQPTEVREEMSASRRAARQNQPTEVREEMSASRRAARQNQPVEDREINASRRKSYATRRNIPCAESIAMQCLEDAQDVMNTQSTVLHSGGDPEDTTHATVSLEDGDEYVDGVLDEEKYVVDDRVDESDILVDFQEIEGSCST